MAMAAATAEWTQKEIIVLLNEEEENCMRDLEFVARGKPYETYGGRQEENQREYCITTIEKLASINGKISVLELMKARIERIAKEKNKNGISNS